MSYKVEHRAERGPIGPRSLDYDKANTLVCYTRSYLFW